MDGGTASFVADVTCADGSPAVLKLALPDVGFHDQLRLLELADGRGYVTVLRTDHERNAALLEPLGAPMTASTLAPEDQIRLVCDLLKVAWQMPLHRYLEQPWNKADQLATMIGALWVRHDHPCSEAVVDQALACARSRAAVPREAWVVVHGDPHPDNVLRVRHHRDGSVGGYVFVDPDGFLADPCYDVGVLMRDWSDELRTGDAHTLLQRYCLLAASRTGLDQNAIWEWAYLERVSSGLFVTDAGDPEGGRRFLETAELLLR